jgi:hypothetical protein
MTENEGGPTVDQGGASKPTQEEHSRELDAIAGNAAGKGEKPSPANRHRGEAGSAGDEAPIDLDAAHDRAS